MDCFVALLLAAAKCFVAVAPALAGRYVNQDELRILLGSEYQGLLNIDAGLIRLTNVLAVDRQEALGNIKKDTAPFGVVEGDLTSCLEITTVDGGICVKPHHIL